MSFGTPVDLVTVHHEGAGAPTDSPRGAHGGYTYWLGVTYYTRLRDVWSSYATYRYNGVSLDVCFSGDRMVHPLTDTDLMILHDAVRDARARGYVVDHPQVRAHRDSPGSSTVCPGNLVMARWPEVVAACLATGPVPPVPIPNPEEVPMIMVQGHLTDGDAGYTYLLGAAPGPILVRSAADVAAFQKVGVEGPEPVSNDQLRTIHDMVT